MPARLHTSVLGRYADINGRLREVLTQPGCAGSLLVLDRDATTRGDRRLVAHLAADEPHVNAALTCRDYLRNPNRWCRSLLPEDLEAAPSADDRLEESVEPPDGESPELSDRRGRTCYRLTPIPRGLSIPELRWQRLPAAGQRAGAPELFRVRDVIGALEHYQPVRTLTARALARHEGNPAVSTSTLRAELERIDSSHIVLNRGLREAVLAAVDQQGLSMSEITLRCGRVKRDARGNRSGNTSWLARRIGLLPEGGRERPTPWVHSDVLALVARQGLGIPPREVELG